MPRSRAMPAARSESAMKTIALTADTPPATAHSAIRSVVSIFRPQSSALTIRHPGMVRISGGFLQRAFDGRRHRIAGGPEDLLQPRRHRMRDAQYSRQRIVERKGGKLDRRRQRAEVRGQRQLASD